MVDEEQHDEIGPRTRRLHRGSSCEPKLPSDVRRKFGRRDVRGWVRDTAPILLSFTLTEIAAILGRLIIKAPHQE